MRHQVIVSGFGLVIAIFACGDADADAVPAATRSGPQIQHGFVKTGNGTQGGQLV